MEVERKKGKEMEQVPEYKYLECEIRIGRDNQFCETQQQIDSGWTEFSNNYKQFFGEICRDLGKEEYTNNGIPIKTYGIEILTLTKKFVNKLRMTYRCMERTILGISKCNAVMKRRYETQT
jgi:hypothetical protein